ncbi:MAG TPA: L-seryl-tRNA(Sec) selenium transferase [Clostridia bacterium]|nr:L-seryl-tRNA(Sec) selenium transferase [Clostridia bacterium]
MKTTSKSDLFRKLPSVDELVRSEAVAELCAREGRTVVIEAARTVLERLRSEIAASAVDDARLELAIGGLAEAVEREVLQAFAYSLRRVINATGVVLHTNLGRAPLGAAVLEHAHEIAEGYSNLEFDISAGERGKRDVHVDRVFRQIFANVPRPLSTIVVNNNAAAVLLSLSALAEGGEVIVSRGELVEIGGSFRIPDVMAKSGAVLQEVGTTNRTRLADYERAITERTRLLLRVHRSNFQIVGFTEQPSLSELAALGRKHNIPVMEDLGSGALVDLRTFGVPEEPNVFDSLQASVDVVTYSGDKLLGGPQAGLLTGAPELIARIRTNPLFRALRVDKLIYATLEATLLAYVRQQYDAIPALRMIALDAVEIRARAERLAQAFRPLDRVQAEVRDGVSVIGGGAAPGSTLPTAVLAVTVANYSADELAAALRSNEPPIIARVEDDRVLLDLRTVDPSEEAAIRAAIERIAS